MAYIQQNPAQLRYFKGVDGLESFQNKNPELYTDLDNGASEPLEDYGDEEVKEPPKS